MTIFKANLNEKKDEVDLHLPEVVSDSMLLIENEKNEAVLGVGVVVGGDGSGGRRRTHACLLLILLPLALLLFASSIWLLQHFQHHQEVEYVGRCGVEFDGRMMGGVAGVRNRGVEDGMLLPLFGRFEQEVEIAGSVESIRVPRIGDASAATILHDFNMNWTVIVDTEKGFCFILGLDRTLVLPPTDFFDLLFKLNSRHFLPDAGVLRAYYKAVTPPVVEWGTYGVHITNECAPYTTFKLIKHGEPVALSKRSACNFAGNAYCLGDAGYDKMLCLRITGCY